MLAKYSLHWTRDHCRKSWLDHALVKSYKTMPKTTQVNNGHRCVAVTIVPRYPIAGLGRHHAFAGHMNDRQLQFLVALSAQNAIHCIIDATTACLKWVE